MANPVAEAQATKALLEKNFSAYKLAQVCKYCMHACRAFSMHWICAPLPIAMSYLPLLPADLQKGIQARTQLTSQCNENEAVIEVLAAKT